MKTRYVLQTVTDRALVLWGLAKTTKSMASSGCEGTDPKDGSGPIAGYTEESVTPTGLTIDI